MKSYVRTGYVTSSGSSGNANNRNTLSKLNDGSAFMNAAGDSDDNPSGAAGGGGDATRLSAREEELAKYAEVQAKKNKRFGARGDRSGIVLIKEKAIISDSFCVGGYSFGSAEDFLYA